MPTAEREKAIRRADGSMVHFIAGVFIGAIVIVCLALGADPNLR